MGKRIVIVEAVSREQLEFEAQQMLKRVQPECLTKALAVNIEDFYENHLPEIADVTSDYQKLDDGLLGLTNPHTKSVIVSTDLVDSDLLQERRRGRATIAHESDHAIRHISQYRRVVGYMNSINCSPNGLILHRQEDIKPFYNPEWQSWWWAKAFLMPLPIFLRLYKSGCSEYELAEIFDVNPAFVRTRINDLKRWGKI